jgi:type 1 glutamine amidotransferase
VAVLALLAAAALIAGPKRVLYVTYSAGFRHDCLPVSAEVLRTLAATSGMLEVVATEDLSLLSANALRNFDAVLFFTSGELPISDTQKQDLLDFVRSGRGFGGAHSATDTFYTWSEYGDLIGGRFNGHPWVQQVRLDVEDPQHPAVAQLSPGFSILDEIYQFRDFSRDHVRVLMTLDSHSVDLGAPGVNPATEDFPLAWTRTYGAGRVF